MKAGSTTVKRVFRGGTTVWRNPLYHVDLYILGGQSNAEGFADATDLSSDDSTQSGLFYASWDSENADSSTFSSSTQYYSNWATSLVAGYTAPDSPQTTIGDNSRFGPEIGLVSRLNELSTTGNKVGILKHAIGSAEISLWADGAAGYTRLLNAIDDGIDKLENLDYTYSIKGVIWWQGESNGQQDITSDYTSFISRLRSYLSSNYNVSAASASQIPFVLTRGSWGPAIETVADADNYTALIDVTEYGQIDFTDTSSWENDPTGSLTAGGKIYVLQDGFILRNRSTGQNVTYNTGDILDVWVYTDTAATNDNIAISDGNDFSNYSSTNGIWSWYNETNLGVDFNPAKNVIRNNVHIGSGSNTASKRYRTSLQNDMFSLGQDYADKLAIATLGQAPLWTPSEITSEGWYDFSDLSTFTLDSNEYVTTVSNKGSGPNLYSHSNVNNWGTSEIVVNRNAQNNKTAVAMFGENDRLTTTSGFNASNSSLKHLYMVLNPSIVDNNQDSIFQLTSGSHGVDLRQFILWAQGDTSTSFFGKVYGVQHNVYSNGNFKNSSNQEAAFSSSDLSNSWNIFELVFDESANTLQFVLNGTLADTATNYTMDLASSMTLSLMFAATSTQDVLEGYWGELVATSDTSNNEKVQGYLAHKWGLADKLPSSHTYKTSAPTIS